ncbi:hypothetical protein HanRHA438_Chr12g0553951 [Helianthus annuus]|nr:hypothetical protein HanRHA438_Chr12g0553951 [Helianthus annuus]
MTMNLMLPFSTLIKQSQLKQGPNIRPFTRKRYKHRYVGRIILQILPIWVKVYRPIIPTNRERIA